MDGTSKTGREGGSEQRKLGALYPYWSKIPMKHTQQVRTFEQDVINTWLLELPSMSYAGSPEKFHFPCGWYNWVFQRIRNFGKPSLVMAEFSLIRNQTCAVHALAYWKSKVTSWGERYDSLLSQGRKRRHRKLSFMGGHMESENSKFEWDSNLGMFSSEVLILNHHREVSVC